MQTTSLNGLSAWLNLGVGEAARAVEEAIGLSERGLAALVLIDSHPARSVDWLYRRLGLTQSGTVRLLDRLEGAGLIERRHLSGRREIEVSITEAGLSVLSRGVAARTRALGDLLAPLSENERGQLLALMSKALSRQQRTRTSADIACRLCDWVACPDPCPVDASVTEEV